MRLQTAVLLAAAAVACEGIFCPWDLGSTLGTSADTLTTVDAPTTGACAEACVATPSCTGAVWHSSNRCELKSGAELGRRPDPFHKFGASGSTSGHGALFDRLLQHCGEEGTEEECRIAASVHIKDCLPNL